MNNDLHASSRTVISEPQSGCPHPLGLRTSRRPRPSTMQDSLLFQQHSAALQLSPKALELAAQMLSAPTPTTCSASTPALSSRSAAACFLAAQTHRGSVVVLTEAATVACVRVVDVLAAGKMLLVEQAARPEVTQWADCLDRVERMFQNYSAGFELYNRLFHSLIGAASQEQEEQLWALWEEGWLLVLFSAQDPAGEGTNVLVLAAVNCILGELTATGRQRAVDLITHSAGGSPEEGSQFDANMLSDLDTLEMLADTEAMVSDKLQAVHSHVSAVFAKAKHEYSTGAYLSSKLDETLVPAAHAIDPRFFLQRAKERRTTGTPTQAVMPSPLLQPSPLKIVRRSLRRSASSGGLRWLFEPSIAESSMAERTWIEALAATEWSGSGELQQLICKLGQEAETTLRTVHLSEEGEEDSRLCGLVKRLFVRTLHMEAACTQRTGVEDVQAVLQNQSFRQCVLALSCEVVIHVYGLSERAFPWVLQQLKVHGFEFSKAVDTFVRLMEPDGSELSGASSWPLLRRHFVLLDCWVCERAGWAADSPVHGLLGRDRAEGGMDARMNSEVLLQEDSVTCADLFNSPTKHDAKASSRPLISQSRVLDLFLRKVLHFAARRVHELCSYIAKTIPATVISEAGWCATEQRVWRVVTSVIGGQHASVLLADRHTDTIILCAIYGVFRISHRDCLSFNEVVDVYKRTKGDSHDSRVYRQVPISNGSQAHGDICEYFNADFVPLMGETIKSIAHVNTQPPASPAKCPTPTLRPFNPSAQAVRSVALYHIGESSGFALEKMNQVLCENRRRKASEMGEAALEPASKVSKAE
eukprot:TRINITY_DN13898_c0_g1_i1.p1 TRINITY_DN13898_c0_g1~~TRINITY_DN13898_c0_g1_i1.p1  ORF type:complete len:814 (+),score=213.26 TRINITY_DN13898_c0_g1_i1:143-2584(+)